MSRRNRMYAVALVATLASMLQWSCNRDVQSCSTAEECESGEACIDGWCVQPDSDWRVPDTTADGGSDGGAGGDGGADAPGSGDTAPADDAADVEIPDATDVRDGRGDESRADADDGGAMRDAVETAGDAAELDGRSGSEVGADGSTSDADAGGPDGGDASTPSTETKCSNGLDDDRDGVADCGDSDCFGTSSCTFSSTETDCGDGFDGDADGRVDCADADCTGTSSCSSTESSCNDGKDNDSDGLIDCDDGDCVGSRCGHIIQVRGPTGSGFRSRGKLSRTSLANADHWCTGNDDGQWKAVMSGASFSAKSRIRIDGDLRNDTQSRDLLDGTGGKRFWDPSRSLKASIAPGLTIPEEVWTGSKKDGTRAGTSHCSDWSSNSGTAAGGKIGPTSGSSTNYLGGATLKCANRHRVLCISGQRAENCKTSGDEDRDGLEDCHDPDCRFAPHCHQKLEVVGSFQGDFGGLKVADRICSQKAGGSNSPYSGWRTVMSDSSTAARDRIRQTRPFVVSQGGLGLRVIASPHNGLFSGGLIEAPRPYADVWTGSTKSGGSSTDHCSDWSMQQAKGRLGDAGSRNYWLKRAIQPLTDKCSQTNPIYCISGQ